MGKIIGIDLDIEKTQAEGAGMNIAKAIEEAKFEEDDSNFVLNEKNAERVQARIIERQTEPAFASLSEAEQNSIVIQELGIKLIPIGLVL